MRRNLKDELKVAKKIIGKRNAMFHTLRKKVTDPVFTATLFSDAMKLYQLLFPIPDSKYKSDRIIVIDLFIIVMAREKYSFLMEDVQAAIDNVPKDLLPEKINYRNPHVRVRTLIRAGYIHTYLIQKQRMYSITTLGKAWLVDINERMVSTLTEALKKTNRFERREQTLRSLSDLRLK